MIRQLILFLIFAIGLSSCVGRKALPEEKDLFPENGKSKWWILNNPNYCALVTCEEIQGRMYYHLFSSCLKSDSNYSHFIMNRLDSAVTRNKKFPITFFFQNPESFNTFSGAEKGIDFRFTLSRKKMHFYFKTISNSKRCPDDEMAFAKRKFPLQNPFTIHSISNEPPIWVLHPLQTAPITKGVDSSTFHLAVFDSASELLELAKVQPLVWMDLDLASGEYITAFFSCDPLNKYKLIGVRIFNSAGESVDTSGLNIHNIPQSDWTSPVSQKTYGLGYDIAVPSLELQLSVTHRIPEQEVETGRNSFWMGAVSVTDKNTGLETGRGNMYIFHL